MSESDPRSTTVQVPAGDEPDERTRVLGSDPVPVPAGSPDDFVHYLVVVEGSEPGRRITLGAAPVTIGRIGPCEVVLPDPDISRRHCRIEALGHELQVTDLGSTNGTYVGGKRLQNSETLAAGAMMRAGRHVLRHELRNRKEVEASESIDRDLAAARAYVESLLPGRLARGPVLTDWLYEPSARIGGDMLGYFPIDARHFALYIIDVAGHGAGAALHAASVVNVLRRQAVSGIDMRRPEQVLWGLNEMFPMGEHGNMYFTAWYGVYVTGTRELRFCSGGHHPGYLVDAGRGGAQPLSTRNLPVGVRRGHAYGAGACAVEAGSTLYLFSDGVFEIEAADGTRSDLDDFLPLLTAPASATGSEAERLVAEVKRRTGRSVFEDDLTLLVATLS